MNVELARIMRFVVNTGCTVFCCLFLDMILTRQ